MEPCQLHRADRTIVVASYLHSVFASFSLGTEAHIGQQAYAAARHQPGRIRILEMIFHPEAGTLYKEEFNEGTSKPGPHGGRDPLHDLYTTQVARGRGTRGT